LPRKIAVQKLNLLRKGVIAPLMGGASEACSVFQNMALLEVGRGCKRACRFCLAGHVYRPPRWSDREAIVKSLEGLDESAKAIGLLAPSVMDMPHFEDLLVHIKESGLKCNISSVRMDSLTENVLHLIKELGQQTITLAIETGSQRLQKVINKNLTEEMILQQIELISKIGFRRIKIYFMVGLPTETKDDILATLQLLKKIRHVMIKTTSHKGVVSSIKVVLSCFVPKPFTPLQWCGMEELNILKERQNAIKKALYKEGGISVTTDVPKWAYVQGLLARGDRRVSELILKGNRCNWDLKRLFAQSILNPEYYIRRNYSLDEYLPWDFIDHGISKDYLVAEFMRAMEGKESPGCGPEGCKRCGVCERW
ncbi:MAG: radical SAM protein, partial [Desulfatiglandales bacterium]